MRYTRKISRSQKNRYLGGLGPRWNDVVAPSGRAKNLGLLDERQPSPKWKSVKQQWAKPRARRARPRQSWHAPLTRRARSPLARRARSPLARRARSPLARRARSPLARRARSPFARRARSPLTRRARSPLARRARPRQSWRAPLARRARPRQSWRAPLARRRSALSGGTYDYLPPANPVAAGDVKPPPGSVAWSEPPHFSDRVFEPETLGGAMANLDDAARRLRNAQPFLGGLFGGQVADAGTLGTLIQEAKKAQQPVIKYKNVTFDNQEQKIKAETLIKETNHDINVAELRVQGMQSGK